MACTTELSRWYFNDVRAGVLALRGGWPTAPEMLADAAEIKILTQFGECLRALPDRRTAGRGGSRTARAFGQLPAEPLYAAALLTLAVGILDDPDGPTTLIRLVSGLPSTSTTHIRLRELAPHCSPRMSAAIRASVRVKHRNVGHPALFPQPATHRGRLDPRTIPAVLPEHWAAPLSALRAPVRQLRRDAAIRLVQMATGHTRAAAGRYLGIAPGAFQSATVTVRNGQKQPGNAAAYQMALRRVVEIAIAEGQRSKAGAQPR
ncbi:hypothetical protein ABT127_29790 [Streptomyces sp. NPDC001904]|uniref:hypothetical protein n=1 Tax=Streptomyces sp. NPDC001904 TaxID=3154531 RepID=UPI003333A126